MKTQEELNALKEEVKALNKKLAELSEEELAQVTGGFDGKFSIGDDITPYSSKYLTLFDYCFDNDQYKTGDGKRSGWRRTQNNKTSPVNA